jgi:glycosyltransferase involved in cell wall biosynthesis
MGADISVILPARNEGSRIGPTIRSIARARSAQTRVEFVVVDDASSDGCTASLLSAIPKLLEEPRIDIRICRLDEHSGTYQTRNAGAELASADVLFMSDAHVRFSAGWDTVVLRHLREDRIVCGVTVDEQKNTRGYGCKLMVPFMGASWNEEPAEPVFPIQIAPCHATALTRELFERLGGYDSGMLYYGGGEPEFSVRAWLHGAEVVLVKELEVRHHFRGAEELDQFLDEVRPFSLRNRIRFGLLYLSELGCLQLLAYYAKEYPEFIQEALTRTDESDVWERRAQLEQSRRYPFDWFVQRFGLRNEAGGEVI